VAIGTSHGVYGAAPKLDIERLRAIRKVVSVPLVLHGASGLSDEVVRECISEGICKVNFATELRIAYTNGVRDCIKNNPNAYDPKSYGKQGYAYVKKLVMEKIALCGAGYPAVSG
jgi:tagatose 1,6-diphosphate aldolase GatY/KbaY